MPVDLSNNSYISFYHQSDKEDSACDGPTLDTPSSALQIDNLADRNPRTSTNIQNTRRHERSEFQGERLGSDRHRTGDSWSERVLQYMYPWFSIVSRFNRYSCCRGEN